MDKIFANLLVITLLAFVVETIVEAIWGRLSDAFEKLATWRGKNIVTLVLTVAIGVLGAWVYHFDILHLAFTSVGLTDVSITSYGITVTGIAIAMGSAYIHQIISKFFPSKDQQLINNGKPQG